MLGQLWTVGAAVGAHLRELTTAASCGMTEGGLFMPALRLPIYSGTWVAGERAAD